MSTRNETSTETATAKYGTDPRHDRPDDSSTGNALVSDATAANATAADATAPDAAAAATAPDATATAATAASATGADASWVERCQNQFSRSSTTRLHNLADDENRAMHDGA